ncbi:hypothetical protein REPUB_Repub13aG0042500 [Reevesia pubescens]
MVGLHAGMVFDPSDAKIVSEYLPKLISTGGDMVRLLGDLSYFFKVCDVYSFKPCLLFRNDQVLLPFMKGNQRFVFSPRQKIAQKNCNGKRPRRILQGLSEGEGGFWKSSTSEKPIFDDHDQVVIGYVNMLNFYEYNTEKKNSRKDAMKTNYIMYEYQLSCGDRFQEWVICKIKNTRRLEADAYEDVWLQGLFLIDDHHQLGLEYQTSSTTNLVE